MHEAHRPSEAVGVSVVVGLLVLAALAGRGWLRLKGRGHPLPGWRLGAFDAGLALVWLTTASPLAGLDHALLTAHMLKHLVLMTLAAPFLLLGEPLGLLAAGVRDEPPSFSSARPRALTHPVVCWFAGTATVLAWHVPAALSLAMHSAGWHALQSATFFLGGLLFWWPVVQPWPARAHWAAWTVPLYLFLATLPCDALSAFLAFCGRPVYVSALSRTDPALLLADQERAGALMWVWVTLLYLVPAAWQVLRLLGPQGRPSSAVAGAHEPEGTKLSW